MPPLSPRTLNLGILAHVDAGKTSLTERLLYAAGAIDDIGSVDDGSTRTDTLALERQRGITIRSAVVSFAVDGVSVNLIDTPGHPDFIAEVERVLGVLDGAVLVVSAVEGVQPQTRILFRSLQRLQIPALIFVNKIDRGGAAAGPVLRSIAERLVPAVVAMGSVSGLGTRAAAFTPYGVGEKPFTARATEVLAEHDDTFLAAYVARGTESGSRVRAELRRQTGLALVHPVFFGSAITGAGVDSLLAAITEWLPAADGDAGAPASGTVFKVERGPAGEKIAYVRLFSGTVRTRERLRHGDTGAGKVTGIRVFDSGGTSPRDAVTAGHIAQLRGLSDIRVGDGIGHSAPTATHHFPPPTLETVVVPVRRGDSGALHAALAQLAEQDPLINLRHDPIRNEMSVSLYGEVQKEVIGATLASDFAVEVSFHATTTICIERPLGTGAAVETIGEESNPFLATVGLRIEPAPIGSGVTFVLGIELGSLPLAFIRAIEESVQVTLQQGIHGWQVTDCTVTLEASGYSPRQSHAHAVFDKSMSSTAGDFRNLTPLVLMAALRRAATTVYEPVSRFGIELPAGAFASVLPALRGLGATPATAVLRGDSYVVEGHLPAARVHSLEQRLPGLTGGEGVLETGFARYEPAPGSPARPRTDRNPLDRKEYLLRVLRRR